MYTGSSTQLFSQMVSSSTAIGNIWANAMVYVPIRIFNTYIGYVIIVAVFGAALAIGWRLWRRFI